MSTRAAITIADDKDSFDIYQHHDGYPDGPFGLVRHIAMARRLAWDAPRFEAGDFAAAVIGVLKDRGGSTYLTQDADAHGDRAFHYRIEPVREDTQTRVMLTITRPSYERGQGDVEIFAGSIQDAVAKFNAVPETKGQPREWQIVTNAEAALYRAEEEIGQWIKGTPDEDTQNTLDDISEATRTLDRLRHHVEQTDPWRVLARIEQTFERLQASDQPITTGQFPTVDVKLAMEAHRRFQRD